MLGLTLAFPAGAFASKAADKPADKAGASLPDADQGTAEKTIPPVLQKAIDDREEQVTAARREAIRLIEDYLRDSPHSREQAEALYKLAELYWEESKAVYLEKMGVYQAAVTACHDDHAQCPHVPHKPPTVDLSRADGVSAPHQRAPALPQDRHPSSTCTASRCATKARTAESVRYFQIILDRYPRSRYVADAWMAIAEYRFYEQQNYKSSLEAYEQVLKHPKSQLYDLALFKTAWCYWKLGDTTRSAMRFKDVLDLAKKKAGRTEADQKRAAELQGQALDYLVELFTEDDTKSAHDAFEFLAQIGGKAYSQKVLKQLADTVFDQTRYERAVEAYQLLIDLDPNNPDAPDYAGKIVEAYQLLGDTKTAVAQMRKLAGDYGAKSPWAAANKDRPKAVQHARTMAEELIRTLAKTMHAEAQANEKATKVVDKDRYARRRRIVRLLPAELPRRVRRRRAALPARRRPVLQARALRRGRGASTWPSASRSPSASTTRTPCSRPWARFEKVRRPTGGKREITESDRLFGEAADTYATLFPNDKEIVTVVFKNGQFFFDYGDYDEAIKRFGLIVEKYPDDPNAAVAGDRILEALNKAKDYENIESWARRLKKTKAFASRDEQDRLDKVVVNAVMKSGEKYANDNQYDKAAAFYMRVAQEYPQSPLAPKALNNAGVVLEKAKKQEDGRLGLQDPRRQVSVGERGARGAVHGRPHRGEHRLLRQGGGAVRAARAEVPAEHARRRTRCAARASCARGLGQHDRAIKHFGEYSKRFKDKPDAKDVAFQIAVVHEDQKDYRAAAQSFAAYTRAYPSDARTVEALAREADADLKAGNDGGAKDVAGQSARGVQGRRTQARQARPIR